MGRFRELYEEVCGLDFDVADEVLYQKAVRKPLGKIVCCRCCCRTRSVTALYTFSIGSGIVATLLLIGKVKTFYLIIKFLWIRDIVIRNTEEAV